MRPRFHTAAAAGMAAMAMMAVGCTKAGSSAAKDVTVNTCTADPAGGKPKTGGQIHNTSSKASTYAIHVKLVDSAGNGVGDAVATVGKVESGATATWTATGTQSANGALTCTLASVTRTVAP